ncbi:MAG: hypothetical protein ABII80_00275 [bacterium]
MFRRFGMLLIVVVLFLTACGSVEIGDQLVTKRDVKLTNEYSLVSRVICVVPEGQIVVLENFSRLDLGGGDEVVVVEVKYTELCKGWAFAKDFKLAKY